MVCKTPVPTNPLELNFPNIANECRHTGMNRWVGVTGVGPAPQELAFFHCLIAEAQQTRVPCLRRSGG